MLISPVSKTTRMDYVFEIGNCLRTGDLAAAIEAADRHSNMPHTLLTRALRKLHCDLVALSREGAGTEADKARRFYTEEFYERACGVLDWDLVRARGEGLVVKTDGEGPAVTGSGGVAVADRDGTASAGPYGVLCFQVYDHETGGMRVIVGLVGENGIKPGTKYRLTQCHPGNGFEIVEAAS